MSSFNENIQHHQSPGQQQHQPNPLNRDVNVNDRTVTSNQQQSHYQQEQLINTKQTTGIAGAGAGGSTVSVKSSTGSSESSNTNSGYGTTGRRHLVSRGTEFIPQQQLRNNSIANRNKFTTNNQQRHRYVVIQIFIL